MTWYEIAAVGLSAATLLVLSITLWYLRIYTGETRTVAKCAVEAMPRPCLVVAQKLDRSDAAVFAGMAASIDGAKTLRFTNIGTGPAVNVRFTIEDASATSDPERIRVSPLAAGETVDSGHPIQALNTRSVVRIDYESVAGTTYRSEVVIEDRRWVTGSQFSAG